MFRTSIKNILINIGYIIVILMFFYTIGLALNRKQIVENFDSKKQKLVNSKSQQI